MIPQNVAKLLDDFTSKGSDFGIPSKARLMHQHWCLSLHKPMHWSLNNMCSAEAMRKC
eukprot:CAMPEP_0172732172 /NCGR_PEP_ID=MMETSP1074-20121228/103776_1 /TAXON_ID=2916 /ORGANISM="Ceratium fusus, Strain PA161109" /LENGTH=57 /DNA_ID=CAMNT_0013560409 /DNA_START=60 /DNA_END=230 /DNA_ORIENTATION=-